MDKPDPEAIAQMQVLGGTWAAYQNVAFDSHNAGHMQFLKVGEGCTYETPPPKYPMDTEHGMGWRYVFIGMVNLETGEVEKSHG